MGEWQGIASAPKTGADIWVASPGNICVAYWAGDKHKFWRHTFRSCNYKHVADIDAYLPDPIWFEPTHWQPLPEPPTAPTRP